MTNSSQVVSAPDSADSVLALLVDRVADRLQAGGTIDIEDLIRDYPERAERIRQLLPAVRLMAGLATPSAASPPENLAAPELVSGVLADFRITRELGRGGMGVVYEAEQISLGRRVALKVLPFAATMDPRHLQRFQNEARAAASLEHPHIVPVYAVGCERGIHYYAMKYIDGQTLAALVAQQQPAHEAAPATPPRTPSENATAAETVPTARVRTERPPQGAAYFRRVAEWGVQAALALEHSHSVGVVHRDIKPANLMIDAQGKLWVTDFGLARAASDTGLTMTGDLLGTLRYMSPEQALAGRGVVDHRTDIYSLGVTLYELLTLRPAFAGADRGRLLQQIEQAEPVPPRRIDKSIPVELEIIVRKSLEKNPGDRYGTAQELAEDLSRYLEDKPIRARRSSLSRRFRRWCGRHKALVSAAAAILFVTTLVVLSTWIYRAQLQAGIEQSAESTLAEAERFYKDRKFPEALAAARNAETILTGLTSSSLMERARSWRADLDMVKALEEIKLQRTEYQDGRFAIEGAHVAYQQAFRNYRIDVLGGEPSEVAAQIGAKAVCVELAAGLDDWSYACWSTKNKKDTTWKDLLVIARTADPDAWRDKVRGLVLENDSEKAWEKLTASVLVKDLPPSTLAILGKHLRERSGANKAVGLLRDAQREHPADFWINWELALALSQTQKLDEAIQFLTANVALRPQSSDAHISLASGLAHHGAIDQAIPVLEKAIQLNPDNVYAYNGLGNARLAQRKLTEAIAAYQMAIKVKPGFFLPHYNLGNAFKDQGNLPKAVAEYREATRLQPNYAAAFINLGNILDLLGERVEAEQAFRTAIDIGPLAYAYQGLGNVLLRKRDLPGAKEAYRRAIDLDPDDTSVHWNLAWALQLEGQFVDSLASAKRAHELGSRKPNWKHPSAEFVRQLEQFVLLDAKLPKITSGEAQPANVGECMDLAMLCTLECRQLYVAAADFYAEAFSKDLKLADGPDNRYNAACAAAMAGCGRGKDAAKLEPEKSVRLRSQALAWLRADLAVWNSLSQKARPIIREKMRYWQNDKDFAGVRDEAALANLPDPERKSWLKLWQDVEDLRKRVSEKP
jgi:serine/threonine protein kinase/Flp pilus assembly protein TadD